MQFSEHRNNTAQISLLEKDDCDIFSKEPAVYLNLGFNFCLRLSVCSRLLFMCSGTSMWPQISSLKKHHNL